MKNTPFKMFVFRHPLFTINFKLFTLLFLMGLLLLSTGVSYADDPDPIYLSPTMECEFTPELSALAEKLDHDPVKIYNWVYENIEFEDYEKSRKGAQATYFTRRGNEWDQCSLLIALLRISGVPARYVKTDGTDRVYVEAWTPAANYRGRGSGNIKQWMPLIPWSKDYRTQAGIDLFPDGNIPADLDFDFENYLSSIRNKTALEMFEEQIQEYLNLHYPGKSLKDVPYQEPIIKDPGSILPASFPTTLYSSGETQTFAEIPNESRIYVKLYLKKYSDKSSLLEKTIYLPEISGKRFCIDFIPASSSDAQIIAGYGNIYQTPEGVAQVKPVLKINGDIIVEGLPLYTGEWFVNAHEGTDYPYKERPRKQAGTFIQMAFDRLSVNERTIEKMKEEIKILDSSLSGSDVSREEYLGRIGNILISTYLQRENEELEQALKLVYCKISWRGLSPTYIYTFPSEIKLSYETKFLIHPSWNIDAMVGVGSLDKFNDGKTNWLNWNGENVHPLAKLFLDLIMHGGSYQEGMIFEDWQDTPGANAVKAIMVANEKGIPVVILTSSDLVNGHLPILENQTENRYSDYTIKTIIDYLKDGQSVKMPVRKVEYESMVIVAYIGQGPDFHGYMFSMDLGGGSLSEIAPTDYDVLPVDAASVYGFGNNISTNSLKTGSNKAPVGDPVDMVKGEFYQQEQPDIIIKSRGYNLEINRTYKSQLTYNGPFGYGWSWNHMERIVHVLDGSLIYFDSDGRAWHMTPQGDGTYQYPPGATFTLEKQGSTYLLTQKNKHRLTFSDQGYLTAKEDLYGNTLTFEYDGQNHMTAMKDSLGRSLTFTYNADGKIIRAQDFAGRACEYAYDGDDLIAFTDLGGNVTQYEYLKNQENEAADHNMSKYILPNGDFLEIGYYKNDTVAYHKNKKGEVFNFQYSRLNRYAETWNEAGFYRKVFFNDANDVVRITTEDKTLEIMAYDENHNKISHTDGNGHTTLFTYDDFRNMTSKTNALAEKWEYDYDLRFNKVSKITDPNGNITHLEYDANGNLIKKTDALEKETTFAYDAFGNNTGITDPLGNTVEKTYDAYGLNLVQEKDKSGNIVSYAYDSIGNMVIKTDPAGHETRYQYNQYNQKTRVTDALDNETALEYNANRKLTRMTQANGATAENIYDTSRDIVAGAKIIRTIDPLGNSEFFNYDEVGNMVLKKDRNGNATRYFYDGLSRLIEEIDPFQNATYYSHDGNGNLVKKTDKRGNETINTYDAANRKTGMTDAQGNTTIYEYDANGNLTRETNTLGVKTLYEYDELNRLKKKTLAEGTADARIFSYEYDDAGNLIKATDPLGNYISYEYDGNGNKTEEVRHNGPELIFTSFIYNNRNLLVKRIDPNGNEFTFEYDALGRKTAQIDPLGNAVAYAYDAVGNIIESTDQLGNKTLLAYNLRKEKTSVTNALGHTRRFGYDKNGNPIMFTDEEGYTTTTYYDSLNRKIGIEDALGNTTLFNYDENGNLVSRVDPLGNVIRYTYDENNNRTSETRTLNSQLLTVNYTYDELNRLTTIIDPNGGQTQYFYNVFNEQTQAEDALNQTVKKDYDSSGRIIKTTDAKDIETYLEYDALGRLKKITQAAGTPQQTVTWYEYDANGNRIKETNALGAITTLEYDPRNLLVKRTHKGQSGLEDVVFEYDYDAAGRLIWETDPREHATTFVYDKVGRKISTTDPQGNATTFTYDKRGNLILETRPQDEQTFYEYDALGRKTKTVVDAAEKRFFYDANGRIIKKINANGVAETYEYDALGRMIAKTEAAGTPDEAKTQYAYDVNGNLTDITNAKYATVSYEYDDINRRFKEIDADGTIQTVEYDENNNITKVTRRDNTEVIYTYDNLNRNTLVQVQGQTEQEFVYDDISRMTQAVDYNEGSQTHTVAYEYDVFNRVTAEVQDGTRVEKAYDPNGNPTLIAYPSGKVLQKEYNNNNLPLAIWDQSGNIAVFTYSGNNRLATMTLANGIEQTIGYNQRGLEDTRTYVQATTTIYGLDSEWDAQGNVLKETISINGHEDIVKDYTYDDLDRVIREQRGTIHSSIWKYDTVGNWVFTNQNNTDEYRSTNPDNEYLTINGMTPAYDANGNMVSDVLKEYIYDWKNRLVEVLENGSTLATYTYDARNRRITYLATGSGHLTTFIYDGPQVIEEYVDAMLERIYVYGAYIDDPIMVDYGGQRFYYLKDRQYSVTAIADASGSVMERYEYTAFGLMKIYDSLDQDITATGSTIGNPYGFTGRRWDKETGLWYYRNRMYSPTLGRFMQRDPEGYVDGMNLYAYCLNNPVILLDPQGLAVRYVSEKVIQPAIVALSDMLEPTSTQIEQAQAYAQWQTNVGGLNNLEEIGKQTAGIIVAAGVGFAVYEAYPAVIAAGTPQGQKALSQAYEIVSSYVVTGPPAPTKAGYLGTAFDVITDPNKYFFIKN